MILSELCMIDLKIVLKFTSSSELADFDKLHKAFSEGKRIR